MSANKSRQTDRRCVATGEAIPPGAPALRFVRDPQGVLTLDLSGKLPGRGAWLQAEAGFLERALKKGGFARSFKEGISLPDGMTPEAYAAEIRTQLTRRTLNQLGLARRAGQCLTGFEVVKAAVPKLIAYVTPSDAAPDGVGKILRTLEARGNAPHIELEPDSTALAEAIGSPGAVHLGLIPGKAAESALYEAIRLRHFTGSDTTSRQ
ncbi:DUF448 domain-containing protein [Parvularcula marina]|uniref:DUF448 domain-containing protein n=1 Tax=Parvularcula marina TaxID=2292771 RepID=UPI003513829E